jgi:hypothetical protein
MSKATMREEAEKWWRNDVGLRNILTAPAWDALVGLLNRVHSDGWREGMEAGAKIADKFAIEAFHEMTESCRDASKDYWSNRESQAKCIADRIRRTQRPVFDGPKDLGAEEKKG